MKSLELRYIERTAPLCTIRDALHEIIFTCIDEPHPWATQQIAQKMLGEIQCLINNEVKFYEARATKRGADERWEAARKEFDERLAAARKEAKELSERALV